MEIVQKKGPNKHTFTFKDDYFNFAYEDKSGSADTDISYGDLPTKSSIQIEQNDWLRNVGYLWCAIGAFQMVMAAYSGDSLAGEGFWLIVGGACVAWSFFSRVKYTVFKPSEGNVFVIQDKYHQKILSELKSRRKKQLLSWYGEVNLENTLESEMSKFKWLLEQGVINKREYESKVAQVEFGFGQSSENSEIKLN